VAARFFTDTASQTVKIIPFSSSEQPAQGIVPAVFICNAIFEKVPGNRKASILIGLLIRARPN
jgi:hypothetical protein